MLAMTISLQAQTPTDLKVTVQQLVDTKYVLRPGDGTDVCYACAPVLMINSETADYSHLNNYTLSQIHSIYYVVAAESKMAKMWSRINGTSGHYGFIEVYTIAYTGAKDYTITSSKPIKKWTW